MRKTNATTDAVSLDVIAQAALGILRNEGLDALSLRRVGEVVGTNHVKIYRRCGSFEGLLDICADYVAADFPLISDSLDWATGTQRRFEAAYDIWTEHADLILLMRGRAWLGMNMTSRFYEPAMRAIVDAGLTIAEAGALFSLLYELTVGSLMSTRANHWTPWESLEAMEKLGAEQFPTLAKVQREVDTSDLRGTFSETVRRLITDFGPRNFKEEMAIQPA